MRKTAFQVDCFTEELEEPEPETLEPERDLNEENDDPSELKMEDSSSKNIHERNLETRLLWCVG
jgi:hypothetical protein